MSNESNATNIVEQTFKLLGKFTLESTIVEFKLAENLELSAYMAIRVLLADIKASILNVILVSSSGDEENFYINKEKLEYDFNDFLTRAESNMVDIRDGNIKNKPRSH